MPEKQNLTFCGLEGLKQGEIQIIKELAVWPFHIKISNAFNIAQKIGISESYVNRCIRRLKYRGIVQKSLAGSYHLTAQVQKMVRDNASNFKKMNS